MFFGDAHRALGDELRGRDDDAALHDPRRVSPRLGALGLFGSSCPSNRRPRVERARDHVDVRALCVAREALAYRSPLADAIFAVQGLGVASARPRRRRREGARDPRRGRAASASAASRSPSPRRAATSPRCGRRRGARATHWVARRREGLHLQRRHRRPLRRLRERRSVGRKKGISAFLVDADAPGLELEPIATSSTIRSGAS